MVGFSRLYVLIFFLNLNRGARTPSENNITRFSSGVASGPCATILISI